MANCYRGSSWYWPLPTIHAHGSSHQSQCCTRIPYTLCHPLRSVAFRIPHQAPEIMLPLRFDLVSCDGSSCIPGYGARVWNCGICKRIPSSGMLHPRRWVILPFFLGFQLTQTSCLSTAEGYYILILCTSWFLISWQNHNSASDSWLEPHYASGTPWYKRLFSSFINVGSYRRPTYIMHFLLNATNAMIFSGK